MPGDGERKKRALPIVKFHVQTGEGERSVAVGVVLTSLTVDH